VIAALYIDPRGPYPRMEGVDCWDEARDARLYAGPWPVVAHPPCGPWSSLRHLYRGAEHDCGPRAVDQVQLYGGVLEQPAGSKLWKRCRLPTPISESPARHDLWQDAFAGFSVEVTQVSWGHAARKPTWLYFVGVDPISVFSTLRTGGTPTHWCSGGRKRSSGSGGLIPPGIKAASAQMRRRTPPVFAEWLVGLARSVRVP
jgi:hypothetical protein